MACDADGTTDSMAPYPFPGEFFEALSGTSNLHDTEKRVQDYHTESYELQDQVAERLIHDSSFPPQRRWRLDKWWTLELISEGVHLSALVAMIVLLWHFHWTPITKWPYQHFTL